MSGVGRSLGAAVTGSRPLGDFEVVPLLGAGALLIGGGTAAFFYPSLLVWPAVAMAAWTGLSLITEALALARHQRRSK